MITKLGTGIIAGVIAAGFIGLGTISYFQSQAISKVNSKPVVVTKIVEVTPTATHSATLNVTQAFKSGGLTKIGTPASATKGVK